MAVGIAISPKIFEHAPAPQVIDHQHDDEYQLGHEPATAGPDVVTEPQPYPEYNRQDAARCCNAKIKFAFHRFELSGRCRVLCHRVIDEKAWQVKKSREPGHHEDDMKSFHPEHDKHRYGLEKLLRLTGTSAF